MDRSDLKIGMRVVVREKYGGDRHYVVVSTDPWKKSTRWDFSGKKFSKIKKGKGVALARRWGKRPSTGLVRWRPEVHYLKDLVLEEDYHREERERRQARENRLQAQADMDRMVQDAIARLHTALPALKTELRYHMYSSTKITAKGLQLLADALEDQDG